MHRLAAEIEAVDPRFRAGALFRARAATLAAFADIRAGLRAGMTEDEARRLALDVFAAAGVAKHWHKPYVRFGPGTALTFHDPLQPEYRLRSGDACSIDLGPAVPDAELGLDVEGDYGDTFVFEGDRAPNPDVERCAEAARAVFREARDAWLRERLTGIELYAFMRERAEARGYVLLPKVDGHRLSDFPHHRHAKERLAEIPFAPTSSHWVLELQLNDPAGRFGAFFEDLLFDESTAV